MDKATDVHDHIVRTQMARFNGYEISTEGDAFTIAFHDAADAVAWSIATQQVGDMCYCTSRRTKCTDAKHGYAAGRVSQDRHTLHLVAVLSNVPARSIKPLGGASCL